MLAKNMKSTVDLSCEETAVTDRRNRSLRLCALVSLWLSIRLLPEIDRHGADDEVDDLDLTQPQFPHLFRHGKLRRIMFQRLQDVGVSVRPAAKNQPDERDGAFQMSEIDFAPERVGRLAKIQHHDAPAGLGHTHHLAHAGFPARQIPQAVAHRHGVEGIVRKRDLPGIALDELQIPGFRVLEAAPGHFQHLFAEVQAGHLRPLPRQGKGDVPRAAAQVQGTAAGLDPGQGHDTPFPQPVQAEALEVVQQVITAGDRGEKVADFGGPLLARGIENVAHGDSLNREITLVNAHKFTLHRGLFLV
jgi:hypothetical protein